ncbi:MAG: type II toxin-antitoxin system VapC family toxin [Anaerolineales bacterium]
MILYLDTSALAKKYILEQDSERVIAWMDEADLIGTAILTRAEIAAALTRAVKASRLPQEGVNKTLDDFRADWRHFQRVQIDESLVARADSFACVYGLRGYDAIHLASGVIWQESIQMPVTFVTFDAELRDAARKAGLQILPE